MSPKERAKLHTELAAGYYERGQMDVALEELSEAMKLDPDNANIYNVYGLVYAVMGENAKAEQNFQRALQLAPQDSDIRHNWGWYLCTHGRAQESIARVRAGGEAIRCTRRPRSRSSTLAAAARRSATTRPPSNTSSARSRVSPGNPNAAYGLALIAYRARTLRRGARLAAPRGAAGEPGARGALPRRVRRAQAAATGRRRCRSRRSCKNRYPDSAETRAIPPESASDRVRTSKRAPTARAAPVPASAGALLRARARPRA